MNLSSIPSWTPYVIVTAIAFGGTLWGTRIHVQDVEAEFRKELARHERTIDQQQIRIRDLEIGQAETSRSIKHIEQVMVEIKELLKNKK